MKKGLLLSAILLVSSFCSSCSDAHYSISFECTHCTYQGEETFSVKGGYETSFKIDFGYQLFIKDIEVTNNGVVDNHCWSFLYQNNIVNSFKIKPNTAKGDIKVKINCVEKDLFEYGLAVDVGAVDQESITFSTPKVKKYIPDWQREAFQIWEDENLDFTFSASDNGTLPTNIGMWMNGRYSKEGVEVNFEYSEDLKSCHVTVPYFVVKDNLQFRLK